MKSDSPWAAQPARQEQHAAKHEQRQPGVMPRFLRQVALGIRQRQHQHRQIRNSVASPQWRPRAHDFFRQLEYASQAADRRQQREPAQRQFAVTRQFAPEAQDRIIERRMDVARQRLNQVWGIGVEEGEAFINPKAMRRDMQATGQARPAAKLRRLQSSVVETCLRLTR